MRAPRVTNAKIFVTGTMRAFFSAPMVAAPNPKASRRVVGELEPLDVEAARSLRKLDNRPASTGRHRLKPQSIRPL